MFWNKKDDTEVMPVARHKELIEKRDESIKELQTAVKDNQHRFELEKEVLVNDHAIELKEKAFEIKHLADEKVKTAEDKAIKLEQEVAVAKKEIEMLVKITDLNADVIDVKKLVGDLINKLPEIKLTSLAGSAPAKGGDKQDKQ